MKNEIKDLLYWIIENAVAEHVPINMYDISNYLQPGDFFLFGTSSTGLTFQFKDLKWVRDKKIYSLLFTPQIRFYNHFPDIEWIPIITYDEEHFSSGDLSMIKKENRFNNDNHTFDEKRFLTKSEREERRAIQKQMLKKIREISE